MDGAAFADIRWRLKLNQKRLAEILSVHPTTVNRWERGAQPIARIVELAMLGLLCEQERRQHQRDRHDFVPLSGSQGPDGEYQYCSVNGCTLTPSQHDQEGA